MGLLGGIAKTAVVAGTATAVSNRVSRRQAGRWAQQDQYDQQPGPPGYAQPAYAAPPAAPPPAAPTPMTEKMDQLKTLADLKSQGALTEAEFAQQKAAILNG